MMLKQKAKRLISTIASVSLLVSALFSYSTANPTTVSATTVNTPFSWDNATVYFTITDRFQNGDTTNDLSYGRIKTDSYGKNIGTFHGGDIKGLTQKINEGYFDNLGVNAIWITAPYEQMHGFVGGGKNGDFAHYGYHGYYALDFTAMDKNMGTVNDFRTFVDTAHSKGIRVVLDVVVNHMGYSTLKDMEEYNYGSKSISSTWTPGAGESFHSYHNYINYQDSTSWSRWWGGWIRSGIAGYTPCGPSTNDITMCLADLPDNRTDVTTSIGIPTLLTTKWSKETTGFDSWIVPAAKPLRSNLNVSPASHIIKWLGAWVEEFGIDGFRVDTVKHVENFRWAELKSTAQSALTKWRQNNPSKPGATWTTPFWMVGEAWAHGAYTSPYFTDGKFDAMINFDFVSTDLNNPDTIFTNYANAFNVNDSTKTFNMLNYFSSHDTQLYDRNNLVKMGNVLLLAPGAAQIYYGDETKRLFGDTGSDPQQGTRSDMNWGSIDQNVLSHFQKLGQFRKNHLSIGSGSHVKLFQDTRGYAFKREAGTDKVIALINAPVNTSVTMNVSSAFTAGSTVKNAYTGTTHTVSSTGEVTINTGANGVALLELSSAGPIDNQAPTTPGTLSAPSKTDTSINLSWGASTDNVGVAGYNIYIGASTTPTLQTTGTGTTASVTGLTGNTTYSFTVKARDAAGNLSNASNALSVTTNPPVNNQVIIYYKPTQWSGSTNIHWRPTGGTWTAVPGQAMTASTTYGGYYTRTLSVGSITGAEMCFNNGTTWDNNATKNYITGLGTFTIENGVVKNGTPDATPPSKPGTLSSPSKTNSSVNLVWVASTDNVGVAGYNIYIGTSTTPTLQTTGTGTTATVTGLSGSTAYSFTVKARDAAGNLSVASNALSVTTLANPTNPTITWTVNNCTTVTGQSCWIVGDFSNWSTTGGIKLQTGVTGAAYPTWKGSGAFTPGRVLTYKVVVAPNAGGTIAKWEGGSNRTYTVPTTNASLTITFTP